MDAKLNQINVKSLNRNIFDLLDNWMLITAGNQKKFNTMTASWGTFGVLWNKPVAICFIRPQRYTFDFVMNNEFFTLSFFEKEHHQILNFCGSHSGKDTDKIAKTGLIPSTTENGAICFSQASLVLECKKLYTDDIQAKNFIADNLIQSMYPSSDFHRFFIGEISNCYALDSYAVK